MSNKILKFGAEWCAPCKSMKKVLENADLGIDIEEIDVDGEGSSELLKKYDVRSVPTLVIVNGDNIISKLVGSKSLFDIQNWLDEYNK